MSPRDPARKVPLRLRGQKGRGVLKPMPFIINIYIYINHNSEQSQEIQWCQENDEKYGSTNGGQATHGLLQDVQEMSPPYVRCQWQDFHDELIKPKKEINCGIHPMQKKTSPKSKNTKKGWNIEPRTIPSHATLW